MSIETLDVDTDYRFATAEQEHALADAADNVAFGFWAYIMSDCLLFAALFATYAVLSHNYSGGPTGQDLFDLKNVLAETMLLLFSSVTYGFAMLAMQAEQRALTIQWLALTFLLGAGFVGLEVTEFAHMVAAGNGPTESGFLSGFFVLVGTHGAHVTTGLLWMAVMMVQVATKGLSPRVRSRLLRLSMFWHFLDVVWIGVFTVVYLSGVIQ
ncbi:MAG TPA: cytochrome o ubiquinol oxidase subunit III [Alphaproteobacteria bacterium]|nr:cytochrome o ubiquinol oxidase subunit III [Alphaproteobacteria bacterium]